MKVLDHGYVELVRHCGGDAAVVEAARICWGARLTRGAGENEVLIRQLLEYGHGTPFEHTMFTWKVKCPIFVQRQWMRHRIGWSYNEQSLRYCTAKPDFYVPGDKSDCPYLYSIKASLEVYRILIDGGWKKEQARGVLPLALYTEFIATCNARSLMHYLTLRLAKGAQWEHQEYARAMLKLFKEVMPLTGELYDEWR